jgi:methylated-DNA-[protein]-cysteine S-methyltransferase
MDENFVVDTPVGRLSVHTEEQMLAQIQLISDLPLKASTSALGADICAQIEQYFQSSRFQFSIPLRQQGTEHQLKVWRALSDIPFGEVMTYGQLAKTIGSSARAVGNACRNNPIPLIVPCHRIVAANDIGGFSGAKQGRLLAIKQSLLQHEGQSF